MYSMSTAALLSSLSSSSWWRSVRHSQHFAPAGPARGGKRGRTVHGAGFLSTEGTWQAGGRATGPPPLGTLMDRQRRVNERQTSRRCSVLSQYSVGRKATTNDEN